MSRRMVAPICRTRPASDLLGRYNMDKAAQELTPYWARDDITIAEFIYERTGRSFCQDRLNMLSAQMI